MKFLSKTTQASVVVALAIPLGSLSLSSWGQGVSVQEATRYRLGPGDRLVMKVFQVEGFEANVGWFYLVSGME